MNADKDDELVIEKLYDIKKIGGYPASIWRHSSPSGGVWYCVQFAYHGEYFRTEPEAVAWAEQERDRRIRIKQRQYARLYYWKKNG